MCFNLYMNLILFSSIKPFRPFSYSILTNSSQLLVPDSNDDIVPIPIDSIWLEAYNDDDDEIVSKWFHSYYHLTP